MANITIETLQQDIAACKKKMKENFLRHDKIISHMKNLEKNMYKLRDKIQELDLLDTNMENNAQKMSAEQIHEKFTNLITSMTYIEEEYQKFINIIKDLNFDNIEIHKQILIKETELKKIQQ